MRYLIDLESIASSIENNSLDRNEVLDILYEKAMDLGLSALIEAIELYWQSKADQLSDEEYITTQEQSIKEQFGS